jgi:hypothetical protein
MRRSTRQEFPFANFDQANLDRASGSRSSQQYRVRAQHKLIMVLATVPQLVPYFKIDTRILNLQFRTFKARSKDEIAPALDHLVGASKLRARHMEDERLRGLETNSSLDGMAWDGMACAFRLGIF